MRPSSIFITLLIICCSRSVLAQDVDWRFGIEYIEIEPPWATETQHDTLLSRLAYVTASQQRRGGINVNGLGGGWRAMQPTESSAISFDKTDAWVRRLARGGFELVWNLELFPEWASVDNTACIDGPGLDDCGPDSAHLDDWYRFVRAVVERYDGDGVDDMPGLIYPVRFYVMPQEIYFAGQAHGDAGEAAGEGYWDDSIENLIRMHREAWRGVHDADPTGNSKLVGSGGWLLDLYSDFPDYPAVDGPTVQRRLNGENLRGTTYPIGFQKLGDLLDSLNNDAAGQSCDYIEWHPHSGWRASDQSLRFLRTHAPDKPMFIDDMWSNLLTDIFPYDGYWQFLRITTADKDFATAPVTTFRALRDSLNANNEATLAWYNAKGARDAIKCFATVFGGGAERISYSLSNDCNPNNPIFLLSQSWRYTGIVGNLNTNYEPKPALYAMRTLVDHIHDFTSVTSIDLTGSPWTRCYRFDRARGTPCYVLWSEEVAPTDPSLPNGPIVTLPVGSDTVYKYDIPTKLGEPAPTPWMITTVTGSIPLALGFTPIILDEATPRTTGVSSENPARAELKAWVNGRQLVVRVVQPTPHPVSISLFDVVGQEQMTMYQGIPADIVTASLDRLAPGVYFVRMDGGEMCQIRILH